MKFRCFVGFHKNKDVKKQITKGRCYGVGYGSPGLRIVRECELCGNISYQKLNLCVPYSDLINDSLWS